MKTRIYILAGTVLAVTAMRLQAQTVIQNTNLVFGPSTLIPPANYAFTVYQNTVATDPTSMWFKYDGTSVQVVNYNIDQASDWYVVSPGSEFSGATIDAATFPTLLDIPRSPPIPPTPNVVVGNGDFWLGVATSNGPIEPRTVYGWVRLHPISTLPHLPPTLQMVENVMTYNSLGVIVGTTTAIPEPGFGIAVMVVIAVGVGATRKRR